MSNNRPDAYAREHLSLLRHRWDDPSIGPVIVQMAAIVFPGVPPEMFLGFTTIASSPRENTTEGVPMQPFHEVGLFQVEAGPREGPAPNPDRHAQDNSWGRLHDSDLVKQLLGRSACMAPGAWKAALPDQIAVGLANLRRHAEVMAGLLDARLLPDEGPLGDWFVRLMFTAFSRGEGQTARVLNPYADRLAEEPAETRWTTYRQVVAAEIQAGDGLGHKVGKMGPAYAITRTDQKLRSGWLLAGETGADRSWWTSEYGEGDGDLQDLITKTAYGASA
jgi:hypothetical protein